MLRPFLRWVGGKSLTMPKYRPYFPVNLRKMQYIDLFVGSGSILFDLKPRKAFISDINKKLMNVYNQIKHHHRSLLYELSDYDDQDNRSYYDDVKERFNCFDESLLEEFDSIRINHDLIENACDFLYLNARCYNGLYRENKSGEFNVSYDASKKVKNVSNKLVINSVHNYLYKYNIKIKSLNFRDSKQAIDNFIKHNNYVDPFFVFDPPYLNTYSNYNPLNDWNEKKYEDFLAFINYLERMYPRMKFLLFNSKNDFISNLFKDYYHHEIQVQRSVSCKPDERSKDTELIITNYRIKSLLDFVGDPSYEINHKPRYKRE